MENHRREPAAHLRRPWPPLARLLLSLVVMLLLLSAAAAARGVIHTLLPPATAQQAQAGVCVWRCQPPPSHDRYEGQRWLSLLPVSTGLS